MEYKPNIYPIMYWAVLYGTIAAVALLAVHLLAGFIAIIWFPVFLAGVAWGGYRKYVQDKAAWMQSAGVSPTPSSGKPKSPVEEFKDAARDIAQAGRELIARQASEDALILQASQDEILAQEDVNPEVTTYTEIPITQQPAEEAMNETPEEPATPQSPLQPLV